MVSYIVINPQVQKVALYNSSSEKQGPKILRHFTFHALHNFGNGDWLSYQSMGWTNIENKAFLLRKTGNIIFGNAIVTAEEVKENKRTRYLNCSSSVEDIEKEIVFFNALDSEFLRRNDSETSGLIKAAISRLQG